VRATHSPAVALKGSGGEGGLMGGWVDAGASPPATPNNQDSFLSLLLAALTLFTLANNTGNLRSICVA